MVEDEFYWHDVSRTGSHLASMKYSAFSIRGLQVRHNSERWTENWDEWHRVRTRWNSRNRRRFNLLRRKNGLASGMLKTEGIRA